MRQFLEFTEEYHFPGFNEDGKLLNFIPNDKGEITSSYIIHLQPQPDDIINFWIEEKYYLLSGSSEKSRKLQDSEKRIDYYHKELSWEYRNAIEMLCSGDLRGRSAENTAHMLYKQLYVLSEDSPMKKYLPAVVEFHKLHSSK